MLQTTCEWHTCLQTIYPPADDVWMTYVICQPKSHLKSHSCVIRMSSARRPRFQAQKYFESKSRDSSAKNESIWQTIIKAMHLFENDWKELLTMFSNKIWINPPIMADILFCIFLWTFLPIYSMKVPFSQEGRMEREFLLIPGNRGHSLRCNPTPER